MKYLTGKQKLFLDSCVKGSYRQNSDGEIDVTGDVELQYTGIKELPVKFGKIEGKFYFFSSKIETLKNFPRHVTESFSGHRSINLKSLIGGPEKVDGDYLMYMCNLKSLEGAPKKIGSNCEIFQNKLTSFKGGPEWVNGCFIASNNELTSLEGAPSYLGENWDFQKNSKVSEVTLDKILCHMLSEKCNYEKALEHFLKTNELENYEYLEIPETLREKFRGKISGTNLGLI